MKKQLGTGLGILALAIALTGCGGSPGASSSSASSARGLESGGIEFGELWRLVVEHFCWRGGTEDGVVERRRASGCGERQERLLLREGRQGFRQECLHRRLRYPLASRDNDVGHAGG